MNLTLTIEDDCLVVRLLEYSDQEGVLVSEDRIDLLDLAIATEQAAINEVKKPLKR